MSGNAGAAGGGVKLADLCADCCATDPLWASLSLGVLLCSRCAIIHLGLGRHISQVVCLSSFRPCSAAGKFSYDKSGNDPGSHGAHRNDCSAVASVRQRELLEMLSTLNMNSVWEHYLLDSSFTGGYRKPSPSDVSLHPTRSAFIKSKYVSMSYMERLACDVTEVQANIRLMAAVRSSGVDETLKLILQGADVRFVHPDNGQTPLHSAILAGDAYQVELLLIHGADPRVTDVSGHSAIDLARAARRPDLVKRMMAALNQLADRLQAFAISAAHETGILAYNTEPQNSNTGRETSDIRITDLNTPAVHNFNGNYSIHSNCSKPITSLSLATNTAASAPVSAIKGPATAAIVGTVNAVAPTILAGAVAVATGVCQELAISGHMPLTQLDDEVRIELCRDLYDEIERRDVLSELRCDDVPFLPVNPAFSSVRNQSRQKLARLTHAELAALIIFCVGLQPQLDAIQDRRSSPQARLCVGDSASPLGLIEESTSDYANSAKLLSQQKQQHRYSLKTHQQKQLQVTSASKNGIEGSTVGCDNEDDSEPLYDSVCGDDDTGDNNEYLSPLSLLLPSSLGVGHTKTSDNVISAAVLAANPPPSPAPPSPSEPALKTILFCSTSSDGTSTAGVSDSFAPKTAPSSFGNLIAFPGSKSPEIGKQESACVMPIQTYPTVTTCGGVATAANSLCRVSSASVLPAALSPSSKPLTAEETANLLLSFSQKSGATAQPSSNIGEADSGNALENAAINLPAAAETVNVAPVFYSNLIVKTEEITKRTHALLLAAKAHNDASYSSICRQIRSAVVEMSYLLPQSYPEPDCHRSLAGIVKAADSLVDCCENLTPRSKGGDSVGNAQRLIRLAFAVAHGVKTFVTSFPHVRAATAAQSYHLQQSKHHLAQYSLSPSLPLASMPFVSSSATSGNSAADSC